MHKRTATAVVITASLAVLMSGCAGVAAQGGQVRDDLSPAANAAIGLARGHVIVTDDLSPTRLTEKSVAQLVQPDAARAWSAEARREFHAQQPVQSVTVEQPFSAEVWRELKGIAPVTVEQRPFSADAIRELKGSAPSVTVEQRPFSDAAKRELKGSAPSVTVEQRPFSADAIRELKGSAPLAVSAAEMQGVRLSAYAEAYAAANVSAAEMQGVRLSEYAEAWSDAAKRELKGSAPSVTVDDDQSPLRGSR